MPNLDQLQPVVFSWARSICLNALAERQIEQALKGPREGKRTALEPDLRLDDVAMETAFPFHDARRLRLARRVDLEYRLQQEHSELKTRGASGYCSRLNTGGANYVCKVAREEHSSKRHRHLSPGQEAHLSLMRDTCLGLRHVFWVCFTCFGSASRVLGLRHVFWVCVT